MPATKKKNRSLSVLVAVYGVLAFAALGRSSYEIAVKFAQAPLPYALSAFSAAVYLVATIALARNTVRSKKVALLAVSIELVGVLVIGSASFFLPDVFNSQGKPVHTVWSYFGIAYGFIPLVLPFAGLYWLKKGTSV